VDQRRARRAHARADGFLISALDAAATLVIGEDLGLDRVRACDPGGPVVRVAVPSQGMAIHRAPQP